jgi:hypothetical protein
MTTKDTLFTVAGITTHTGQDINGAVSSRTKVRYGTDLIRLIKMLNNPKKIEDKTLGICLAPVRVDFVELPVSMIKIDALKFLATHPDFQSSADQATIQDEIDERTPRVKKSKATPSIDSIKSRMKRTTTVEQVLAAIQPSTITE